jgi:sugar phosphate isomerase/epimerase
MVSMSDNMEKVKQDLDKLNALKMKFAVCYWPWFVGAPFKLEDCKRSVETLNNIGEVAKKEGLKFCWHNHDKEFREMEEGLPFDYLMEHTDKDLVSCEMDIYWVAKGGANPLEVLKKYDGRIPILHIKDMANDAEKTFACPGDGIIDFPAVFAEAKNQNIKHYFVERDNAPDGLACLQSSGEYLQHLKF